VNEPQGAGPNESDDEALRRQPVALQVLHWLHRTPESFLAGRDQNGVAKERAGLTPSMLTYLATGPLIGFPRVMVLTQWLGRSAADFVRARSE
jgi:hypothetical protein